MVPIHQFIPEGKLRWNIPPDWQGEELSFPALMAFMETNPSGSYGSFRGLEQYEWRDASGTLQHKWRWWSTGNGTKPWKMDMTKDVPLRLDPSLYWRPLQRDPTPKEIKFLESYRLSDYTNYDKPGMNHYTVNGREYIHHLPKSWVWTARGKLYKKKSPIMGWTGIPKPEGSGTDPTFDLIMWTSVNRPENWKANRRINEPGFEGNYWGRNWDGSVVKFTYDHLNGVVESYQQYQLWKNFGEEPGYPRDFSDGEKDALIIFMNFFIGGYSSDKSIPVMGPGWQFDGDFNDIVYIVPKSYTLEIPFEEYIRLQNNRPKDWKKNKRTGIFKYFKSNSEGEVIVVWKWDDKGSLRRYQKNNKGIFEISDPSDRSLGIWRNIAGAEVTDEILQTLFDHKLPFWTAGGREGIYHISSITTQIGSNTAPMWDSQGRLSPWVTVAYNEVNEFGKDKENGRARDYIRIIRKTRVAFEADSRHFIDEHLNEDWGWNERNVLKRYKKGKPHTPQNEIDYSKFWKRDFQLITSNNYYEPDFLVMFRPDNVTDSGRQGIEHLPPAYVWKIDSSQKPFLTNVSIGLKEGLRHLTFDEVVELQFRETNEDQTGLKPSDDKDEFWFNECRQGIPDDVHPNWYWGINPNKSGPEYDIVLSFHSETMAPSDPSVNIWAPITTVTDRYKEYFKKFAGPYKAIFSRKLLNHLPEGWVWAADGGIYKKTPGLNELTPLPSPLNSPGNKDSFEFIMKTQLSRIDFENKLDPLRDAWRPNPSINLRKGSWDKRGRFYTVNLQENTTAEWYDLTQYWEKLPTLSQEHKEFLEIYAWPRQEGTNTWLQHLPPKYTWSVEGRIVEVPKRDLTFEEVMSIVKEHSKQIRYPSSTDEHRNFIPPIAYKEWQWIFSRTSSKYLNIIIPRMEIGDYANTPYNDPSERWAPLNRDPSAEEIEFLEDYYLVNYSKRNLYIEGDTSCYTAGGREFIKHLPDKWVWAGTGKLYKRKADTLGWASPQPELLPDVNYYYMSPATYFYHSINKPEKWKSYTRAFPDEPKFSKKWGRRGIGLLIHNRHDGFNGVISGHRSAQKSWVGKEEFPRAITQAEKDTIIIYGTDLQYDSFEGDSKYLPWLGFGWRFSDDSMDIIYSPPKNYSDFPSFEKVVELQKNRLDGWKTNPTIGVEYYKKTNAAGEIIEEWRWDDKGSLRWYVKNEHGEFVVSDPSKRFSWHNFGNITNEEGQYLINHKLPFWTAGGKEGLQHYDSRVWDSQGKIAIKSSWNLSPTELHEPQIPEESKKDGVFHQINGKYPHFAIQYRRPANWTVGGREGIEGYLADNWSWNERGVLTKYKKGQPHTAENILDPSLRWEEEYERRQAWQPEIMDSNVHRTLRIFRPANITNGGREGLEHFKGRIVWRIENLPPEQSWKNPVSLVCPMGDRELTFAEAVDYGLRTGWNEPWNNSNPWQGLPWDTDPKWRWDRSNIRVIRRYDRAEETGQVEVDPSISIWAPLNRDPNENEIRYLEKYRSKWSANGREFISHLPQEWVWTARGVLFKRSTERLGWQDIPSPSLDGVDPAILSPNIYLYTISNRPEGWQPNTPAFPDNPDFADWKWSEWGELYYRDRGSIYLDNIFRKWWEKDMDGFPRQILTQAEKDTLIIFLNRYMRGISSYSEHNKIVFLDSEHRFTGDWKDIAYKEGAIYNGLFFKKAVTKEKERPNNWQEDNRSGLRKYSDYGGQAGGYSTWNKMEWRWDESGKLRQYKRKTQNEQLALADPSLDWRDQKIGYDSLTNEQGKFLADYNIPRKSYAEKLLTHHIDYGFKDIEGKLKKCRTLNSPFYGYAVGPGVLPPEKKEQGDFIILPPGVQPNPASKYYHSYLALQTTRPDNWTPGGREGITYSESWSWDENGILRRYRTGMPHIPENMVDPSLDWTKYEGDLSEDTITALEFVRLPNVTDGGREGLHHLNAKYVWKIEQLPEEESWKSNKKIVIKE